MLHIGTFEDVVKYMIAFVFFCSNSIKFYSPSAMGEEHIASCFSGELDNYGCYIRSCGKKAVQATS